MTPVEAAKIVTMLANAPDGEGQAAWTLETQEVFAQLIEDLEFEPTKAAAMAWLKTQRRRPSIADIRSACRQQLETAGAIPTDLDPDQAWGIVIENIRRVGRYQPFPSTHPAIKRAVDAMGWEDICNSENPDVVRAQFERFYRAVLGRERDARHAAPALQRPDDQVRLAGGERKQLTGAKVLALPNRSAALDEVRKIHAVLETKVYRDVPEVSKNAEKEGAELREPTEAERRVAEGRKAQLREQGRKLAS